MSEKTSRGLVKSDFAWKNVTTTFLGLKLAKEHKKMGFENFRSSGPPQIGG